MVDTLTILQRQLCMSHNKGKGTSPELFVRKLISLQKFRFSSHRKDLPGRPDIVFVSRKKVIFINGCFWHRHTCKKGLSMPATRKKIWQGKFSRTIERDKRNKAELKKLGWQILVIWECQIKKPENIANKIRKFLMTAP